MFSVNEFVTERFPKKICQLQVDLANSSSVNSNFPLFRNYNHSPWIWPSAISTISYVEVFFASPESSK